MWQATVARRGGRCIGALRFVASSRVVRCRQSRHVALRIVAGSCAARMAVFCQCSAIRAVYLRVAVFTFCLVSGPSSPRCFAQLRRAAFRRGLLLWPQQQRVSRPRRARFVARPPAMSFRSRSPARARASVISIRWPARMAVATMLSPSVLCAEAPAVLECEYSSTTLRWVRLSQRPCAWLCGSDDSYCCRGRDLFGRRLKVEGGFTLESYR